MSPTYPSAIEVFDLAENEDMLSPVEVDPEKLAHKYKEVRQNVKKKVKLLYYVWWKSTYVYVQYIAKQFERTNFTDSSKLWKSLDITGPW